MRFHVSDLLKAATGTTRSYELSEPFDLVDEAATLLDPVEGQVRLIRDHAGILVQGVLATRAEVACVRCLESVAVPLSLELAEEFLPTVYIPGGPVLQPAGEREAATEIDEHHVLDLQEVIRQGLVLALPVHALCRDACRGLCPHCGINRNDEACECRPEADTRWAALAALRDANELDKG